MIFFRVKGTDEVLRPWMTDNGIVVLMPITGEKPFYIDDYFHFYDEDSPPILEFSTDSINWKQLWQ